MSLNHHRNPTHSSYASGFPNLMAKKSHPESQPAEALLRYDVVVQEVERLVAAGRSIRVVVPNGYTLLPGLGSEFLSQIDTLQRQEVPESVEDNAVLDLAAARELVDRTRAASSRDNDQLFHTASRDLVAVGDREPCSSEVALLMVASRAC